MNWDKPLAERGAMIAAQLDACREDDERLRAERLAWIRHATLR